MRDVSGWTKKRAAIFVCRFVIPPAIIVLLMAVGPLRLHGSFDLNCAEWVIRGVLAIWLIGMSQAMASIIAGAYEPKHVAERKSIFTGGPYIWTPSRPVWFLGYVPALIASYVVMIFGCALAGFLSWPDLGLWALLVGFIGVSLFTAVVGWQLFKLYRFLYHEDRGG